MSTFWKKCEFCGWDFRVDRKTPHSCVSMEERIAALEAEMRKVREKFAKLEKKR